MENHESQTALRERVNLRGPHRWAVIFWNDDFTTMDFVVRVLVEVFRKPEDDAGRLMMEVHQKGQAVVGTYTYDVAVSRCKWATEMARAEGFPLKITYKEV